MPQIPLFGRRFTGLSRAQWLAAGALLLGAIACFSLIPQSPAPMDHGLDKLYHVLAYFALMLAFTKGCSRTRWPQLALICVVASILLEVAQYYGGYRTLSLADMAASTAGVASAWLLAVLA
jgi:VanZ family protein